MFNPIDMKWTGPKTNKTYTMIYERNQVIITGMIENRKNGEVTLEVSTWGGEATLSFNTLYDNMNWNEMIFSTGIIYFEQKKRGLYSLN